MSDDDDDDDEDDDVWTDDRMYLDSGRTYIIL